MADPQDVALVSELHGGLLSARRHQGNAPLS
jgi:hypothetical protein